MNFVDDREVNNAEVVSEVLLQLGLPATQIIDDALSEPNKLALRDQTAAAIEKGIFGAPTFFVRGEMFWGNDRLDDALEFAVR